MSAPRPLTLDLPLATELTAQLEAPFAPRRVRPFGPATSALLADLDEMTEGG